MIRDLEFLRRYGAGHPDTATARNVLDVVIPSARRWIDILAICGDDVSADLALVEAAETQARATLGVRP